MKTLILILLYSILLDISYAQKIIPDSLYWGQTLPGDSAIVFAPGIISLSNRRETKIVFSPDGMECLIGLGLNGTLNILYSNHNSGYWTDPVPAGFITVTRPIEPFFSPDSLHIFFTSLADIYVCNRVNQTWSAPVRLNSPISTGSAEYHPTVTMDGTLYFCSMRENSGGYIYRSKLVNGNYSIVEKLSSVINRSIPGQVDGAYDPFIAADESYIIFTSLRSGGYGQEDQYISYNRNGDWTNPKNLGSLINTNAIEYGSYISPDSKYYFFSRPSGWNWDSPADIYWVSAEFIEKLKYTNFIPYLKNQIPNQTDSVVNLFTFVIPDSTFMDDDGNNTITYSATLSDGSNLPSWLNFNPATRTFSGTPTTAGTSTIKVTVTDSDSAKASCTFTVVVTPHTSIHQMNENIIDGYKLFQNYPNPFNPSTVISYTLPGNSLVCVKIYNILGKEIITLVNSLQKRGLHDITFNTNNLYLASGIYIYTLTTNEINTNKVFKETKVMNYIK